MNENDFTEYLAKLQDPAEKAEFCLREVKNTHGYAFNFVPEVLREEVKNAVGC